MFFHRTLAVALSVCLLLGNPPAYSDIPRSSAAVTGAKVELVIPEELGTLEESRAGTNPKTVIYIQDAHDSLEAQENIAKLIQDVVARYGVKIVLEEGYEGPVPTDKYFNAIKNPKIRKKVAYFLMDKLRLSGAEYAHITRKKDFNLMGADNLLLHRKNIEHYQASEKNREDTEADLQAMDAEIRKLTQRAFTHELKEWMGLKEKLDRKELDLLDYLKRTQMLFLKGISFEDFRTRYPGLSLLLSAKETGDLKLLDKLKVSVNYRTIFQEINRVEDDYAVTHLSERRDRQIFRYYKLIQLFKRLNAIEVTEEEYEAAKGSAKDVQTENIADFIAAQTGQSLVLSKHWEKNIQSAIKFYEVARERDGSIESRLKDYAASEESAPVVLVYGGFHKGRIKELLQQSGLSYVVVSPKISSVSPRHEAYYRQLMRMGYSSMALPKLVATATSPPRLLDFAALSPKREVRLRKQLAELAVIAERHPSDDLAESAGVMDLAWGRRSALRHIPDGDVLKQSSHPARAEMRTVPPAQSSAEKRTQIAARIQSPLLDENRIQTLSTPQAMREFALFRDSIIAAPGMAEFFSPVHLEMLYQSVGEQSYQAQFNLAGGLTLTIVSLLRTDGSNRRAHIFKVKNGETGVEKVVGYMNYSIIQSSIKSQSRAANIGFDIYIPYRKGGAADLGFNSAEIFEASLQMIRHFNPEISGFEVRTNSQLRDHWSGKKEGEGTKIGDGYENARFYLRQGFYPPDNLAMANALMERRRGRQALANGELDQLIQAHEVWVLPLARAEMRSVPPAQVISSPFPNLKESSDLRVSDLQFALFGKYTARNIFRGGPIRQPEYFVFFNKDRAVFDAFKQQVGDAQDKSPHIEFTDPRDAQDFRTVIHEFLSGQIPFPLIFKPNSQAWGNGIFYLTRKSPAAVTVTMADKPGDYYLKNYLVTAGHSVRRPQKNVIEVELDVRAVETEKFLYDLWTRISVDAEEKFYDAGMVESVMPKITIEGKTYETRHIVSGNISSDRVEDVILEKRRWTADIGKSSFFKYPEARELRGGHYLYFPLYQSYVPESQREAFKAYVDQLLKEEFVYMVRRLKAAGIHMDREIMGSFDLMWLPPEGNGFPIPALVETSFIFPWSDQLPDSKLLSLSSRNAPPQEARSEMPHPGSDETSRDAARRRRSEMRGNVESAMKVLQTSFDASRLVAAIETLQGEGLASAAPVIAKKLEYFNGPDGHRVRRTALNALAAMGAREYLPQIAARLKDENPKVIGAALNALRQLGDSDHKVQAEQLSQYPNHWVAKNAKSYLRNVARLGNKAVLGSGQFMRGQPRRGTRRALRFGYTKKMQQVKRQQAALDGLLEEISDLLSLLNEDHPAAQLHSASDLLNLWNQTFALTGDDHLTMADLRQMTIFEADEEEDGVFSLERLISRILDYKEHYNPGMESERFYWGWPKDYKSRLMDVGIDSVLKLFLLTDDEIRTIDGFGPASKKGFKTLSDFRQKLREKYQKAPVELPDDSSPADDGVSKEGPFFEGSIHDPAFYIAERERASRTPTLAVDLMNTLAYVTESGFALRPGIQEQLQKLKDASYRLVLWTSNTKKVPQDFFKAYPEIAALFDLAITKENFKVGWTDSGHDPDDLARVKAAYGSDGVSSREIDMYFDGKQRIKDIAFLKYRLLIDNDEDWVDFIRESPLFGRWGYDETILTTPQFDSTQDPVKDRQFVDSLADQVILLAPLRASAKPALAIQETMPVWYFLRAFGFDPQLARIHTDPRKPDWGRVELSADPQARRTARQSALRVMVSETWLYSKGLRPFIQPIIENPETESLREFYLLTYQGTPAALIWPLPGKGGVLYYPFLTHDNGGFFKSTLTGVLRPVKDLKSEIFQHVRNQHVGPHFNVLENPFYDDNLFAHPGIHWSFDPKEGVSFPSIYAAGELSTHTLRLVFDQIDFNGKSVVEIGSGNGRLLGEAAALGAAQATGYETSELGVQNTLAWAALNGIHHVRAFLDLPDKEYLTADIYLLNSPNIDDDAVSSSANFDSQTYEKARQSNIAISQGDFKEVLKKTARAMHSGSELYLRVGTSEQKLTDYLKGTGLRLVKKLDAPADGRDFQGSVYKLRLSSARSETRENVADSIAAMPYHPSWLTEEIRGQLAQELPSLVNEVRPLFKNPKRQSKVLFHGVMSMKRPDADRELDAQNIIEHGFDWNRFALWGSMPGRGVHATVEGREAAQPFGVPILKIEFKGNVFNMKSKERKDKIIAASEELVRSRLLSYAPILDQFAGSREEAQFQMTWYVFDLLFEIFKIDGIGLGDSGWFTIKRPGAIQSIQRTTEPEYPRSEMRRNAAMVSTSPVAAREKRLNLKQILQKAGPTRIFVDVAAPVAVPEQTAGELARLAKAGAEVVIYNLKSARSENHLSKILETFPKALFHRVSGSFDDALEGSEHAPEEMNLVHYSESESEAKSKAPAWAGERLIYLAGKAGSAVYGLSQIKALRKAVALKQGLPDLEITFDPKRGYHLVSETKSAWMISQMALDSYVAFAQAA